MKIMLIVIKFSVKGYSLVLNRRPATCIRHNLDYPCSSCNATMFFTKKFGLSCISPWFSTFLACFRQAFHALEHHDVIVTSIEECHVY